MMIWRSTTSKQKRLANPSGWYFVLAFKCTESINAKVLVIHPNLSLLIFSHVGIFAYILTCKTLFNLQHSMWLRKKIVSFPSVKMKFYYIIRMDLHTNAIYAWAYVFIWFAKSKTFYTDRKVILLLISILDMIAFDFVPLQCSWHQRGSCSIVIF